MPTKTIHPNSDVGWNQPVDTLNVSCKVVSWTHEMGWHGAVIKKYTDWQRKTMCSTELEAYSICFFVNRNIRD